VATTAAAALVHGYLRVDSFPRVAKRAGLKSRVAVALSSYSADSADAILDRDLYREVLAASFSVEAVDSLRVTGDHGVEAISLKDSDASELCRYIEGRREPYSHIELLRDGVVIAVLVCEFWVNVGGPVPYHDTYTFAFYSSPDVCTALESAIKRRFETRGVVLTEFRGRDTPRQFDMLSWLRRIFGL
jgi:hypothetical protein